MFRLGISHLFMSACIAIGRIRATASRAPVLGLPHALAKANGKQPVRPSRRGSGVPSDFRAKQSPGSEQTSSIDPVGPRRVGSPDPSQSSPEKRTCPDLLRRKSSGVISEPRSANEPRSARIHSWRRAARRRVPSNASKEKQQTKTHQGDFHEVVVTSENGSQRYQCQTPTPQALTFPKPPTATIGSRYLPSLPRR